MSYNKAQFRDLIERVLQEYGLFSPSATNLLLGTAAQESKFGTYLKQIKGPALGPFQIEPATFRWLRDVYGSTYKFASKTSAELEWNLKLSILVCRLRYYIVPVVLPLSSDIKGFANYWKQHYNTVKGKGKPEEFIANYNKYVR